MQVQFSQEQLVLQAVWRKALREGEVVLKLGTDSDATRMRFALYNAVRAVRKGQMVEKELLQAVAECSVRKEGCVVRVLGKARQEGVQAALAALGMSLEEVSAEAQPLTPDEAEAAASEARFLAKMQAAEPLAAEHVPNPYYDRTRD